MRDILTFLAGLLILVLVAALAIPPLVDWTAHRGFVERGMARAFGREVRTEGALDLRLLPFPRIRVQRLRVGGAEQDAVTLDAMYVRAEIALTPLLAGEVRFLDTRIGRAEIKLPTGAGGDWRVPARLLSDAAQRKGWAIEDLRIEQFLLTTADPATGRTDQHAAEAVRIQAASLLGPWRFEGRSRGLPVEIAMGEMTGDRSAALKIGIGGNGMPRLDLDGQLALEPRPGDVLRPRLAGTAKLVAGVKDFPVQAQAGFAADGATAELTDLTVEAGEGAAAVRLTGEGRYRLPQPALSLGLSARRVDLQALRRVLAPLGMAGWRQGSPLPLALSLKLDSVAIGGDEDLSQLSLSLSTGGERGEVRAFEVFGPGRSRLKGEGTFWLGAAPGAAGRVSLVAADGQRLARALESLGVPGLAGFVQPEPLEAAAEMSIVDPVVSLRGLRLSQGELRLSGAIRHTAAEDGARARLDAQLAIEGLDVSALPQGAPLFALARDRDLGLTVDARNVGHGGRKGGRITGRLLTEGSSVVVESLEVRDLAGAEADLSGRIAPDGSGRIEGRLQAPRAAPLLDLFGQAWIGGLSRLLPETIRDDAVDLRVEVEQTGGREAGASSILTVLRGRLGGAPFDASTRTGGGRLAAFRVEAEGDALVGASRPAATPAGRLTIAGERAADGRLSAAVSGVLVGLTVETLERLRLADADDRLETGVVRVRGADGAPLLTRLGVPATGPVPVSARIAFMRRDVPAVILTGEIAGTKIAADVSGNAPSELRGTASIDALSLPWLASVLALGPVQPAASGTLWPTGRFGPPPRLPFGGSLDVRATSLDLGRGLRARDAAFALSTSPTGFRASRLDLRIGEARLRGEFAIERQEGLASLTGDVALEGLSLPSLMASPFGGGRLALKLRFGSSGESVAGLVAGLGGAGDVTVENLSLDGADPGGPTRLAARVLRTDDPIASQKWQPQLAEELGRGALVAAAPVGAPGALVGGVLRLSPLRIESDGGNWQGAANVDFRTLSLEMRGALQSKALPRNWSGAPPTLGLGWSGPFGRITRTVDPAPLVNGLATNVLARELDRVETFELDAAERKRRNSREEMERQRRAEEARRRREREQQQASPPPTVPPLPPPAPYPAPADPGG